MTFNTKVTEMEKEDKHTARLKILSSIKDPSEFISFMRAITAEDAQMSVSEIFLRPGEPDAYLVEEIVGVWLIVRARLPLAGKAHVTELIGELIGELEKARERLPDDKIKLDAEALRFLRRGIDKFLVK